MQLIVCLFQELIAYKSSKNLKYNVHKNRFFYTLTYIKVDNHRLIHAVTKTFITFAPVCRLGKAPPSDVFFNYIYVQTNISKAQRSEV